jgi:hypothetical protein
MMKTHVGKRVAALAEQRLLLLFAVAFVVTALALASTFYPGRDSAPGDAMQPSRATASAAAARPDKDQADEPARHSIGDRQASMTASGKQVAPDRGAGADAGKSVAPNGAERPDLWQLEPDAGSSQSQLRAMRHRLEWLAAQGEAAVDEIRWYLESDDGTSSPALRLALFEILREIGGREAEAVLSEELQVTADPQEIAVLAGILEEIAPETYRDLAAQAARETLELAWQGHLEGRDVTPLMGVLRDFEEPRDAARELHRNLWKDWGPAAMVALAELERGRGIQLVERMARSSIDSDPLKDPLTDRRLLALRVLAQSMTDNPQAQGILLDQASADRIPDWYWPVLASALTGTAQLALEKPDDVPYETHQIGDQVIYSFRRQNVDGDVQTSQRLALIDELIAVSKSADGLHSLLNAADALTRDGYR